MADQQVIFLAQRDEVQPLGLRCGGNSQPHIRLSLRNSLCDRIVAGFFAIKSRNIFGLQLCLRHQVCQDHARARAQWAIDKLRMPSGHILQTVQLQRVARRHHQPLGAAAQPDAAVLLHIQQGFVDVRRH